MERENKKRALSLGIRIGLVFIIAVAIIIIVAYYILSQNFHKLLTNYTIKLVEAMTEQGVEVVENELEKGRNESAILAGIFHVPEEEQSVEFPQLFRGEEYLRMVYVTKSRTVSSDGRRLDIRERPDIQAALQGEPAIQGPYYNEEGEFLVCYTSPVNQDGRTVGAVSIEKDGYLFSELIRNIKFVNTGESYIIDAEGTDIAVSDKSHMEWVTGQYNARRLLAEDADEETRIIMELEQKGLDGQEGIGVYYWHGDLYHVVYQPIPSVNWVLLAGLREEELSAMTQSALFSSISKGPALAVCLVLFLVLTALIVIWIISSMKENAEINEKLEIIANHDALTGLLNRRYLETSLTELWQYPVKVPSSAAIFMLDIDNFKQYNDHFGHPKGDDCLRKVADVMKLALEDYKSNVVRYGGEEFLAAVFQIDRQTSLELGQNICRLVEAERLLNSQDGFVTVSVGVCFAGSTLKTALYDCIQIADKALYKAKKDGKNRAVVLDVPLTLVETAPEKETER